MLGICASHAKTLGFAGRYGATTILKPATRTASSLSRAALVITLEVLAAASLGAFPILAACGSSIEDYDQGEGTSKQGVPPVQVKGQNPGVVNVKVSGGSSQAGATARIQPRDGNGNAQGDPVEATADENGNVSVPVEVNTDTKSADIEWETISGTILRKKFKV